MFKPDYGDRVSEDSLAFDGKTGRELHNLLSPSLLPRPWQRPSRRAPAIHWCGGARATSARSATPAPGPGDTQVTWEGMRGALRGGLSAGFGAEACWSHDIGGFVGDKPSEELYIRWAQWGLLSPFARFHGTSPREPWEYGPRALEVVRHYAQLRYTLVPYLCQCAEESSRTGLPILRHLALEFPDDPAVINIDDEYLLGPAVLVAPVMENWRPRAPRVPPRRRMVLLRKPGGALHRRPLLPRGCAAWSACHFSFAAAPPCRATPPRRCT